MSTQVADTQITSPVVKRRHASSAPKLYGPLVVILLTVTAWSLTLNNGIFIDESVYIRSGRAYIEHWLHGTPLPVWVGEGFSGHPMLYPALAGGLDMLGGLALVRLFSLACIIATALLLRSIASDLFGRRSGLVAAAIFGLTGPVLYVSHLGTFDALVTLMLVGVWRIGMRPGWRRTIPMAVLLALAVLTKYTAYVFVPTLLALSLFDHYSVAHSMRLRDWVRQRPRIQGKRVIRAVTVGILVFDFLAVAYLLSDNTMHEALKFTTTGRSALSPTPRGVLVGVVPDYIWPILFAALLGLAFLIRSQRWGAVAWGVLLIGTSLLLPVAQIKLGEGVSFQKHLAYSAAFLAPLAGWGFARPWKLAIWTPVLVWWFILMAIWGGFRSNDLIQYPDVRPVADSVHFPNGRYLSSSADSLSYYTRDDTGVKWETTFQLYAQGRKGIEEAVNKYRFKMIVIQGGNTGSTIQDEGQAVLVHALDNASYNLKRVGEDKEWLIFTPRTLRHP